MSATFQTRRPQAHPTIQDDEEELALASQDPSYTSSRLVPNSYHQDEDDFPDPDTEWVLFDPNPTQLPPINQSEWASDFDPEENLLSSNRSLNLSNLLPPQQHPLDWEDEELDDVLSIPDSICLSSAPSPPHSSSPSNSEPHPARFNVTPTPLQLDVDDAALLITPHAISAGLSSSPRRQKNNDPALSNRTPSIPDGRGRAWGRRTADPYTTRSQSHRPRRGTTQTRSHSRKSNQPVIRLSPPVSAETFIARSPIRTEQVALRFLAKVANRIMTVDSDTVTMVADAVAPSVRPRRPDLDRTKAMTRNDHPKFSIGDDDSGLAAGNELSSPLDLSRLCSWLDDESEQPQLDMNDDEHDSAKPIAAGDADTVGGHPRWARVLTDWTKW